MDLSRGRHWEPPSDWLALTVIDSHAGGEPFRLVVDGLPEIPGDTILARRRYARDNLDHLRRMLMSEPRGHADMYGGWIGTPVRDDSQLSVLFLHNEGFSTMCGHGIIALTKIVLDTGIVPAADDDTTLRFDTPAGQITATATTATGSVGEVSFQNVPSFVDSLDNVVDVEGIGEVRYDLAFGGAFYAYVDGPSVGIAWPPASADESIHHGRMIKDAVMATRHIAHPVHEDLGFLYGVIFTGPAQNDANYRRNVCVFADGQIDRSPTGTGLSGHLAIAVARGILQPGESITVESIVGSEFSGRAAASTSVGTIDAVIPEIEGTARITGRAELWFDPDDELSPGFLIR